MMHGTVNIKKGMKLCTAMQEGCGYKDTLRAHRYFAPSAKYFTVCITYQPPLVIHVWQTTWQQCITDSEHVGWQHYQLQFRVLLLMSGFLDTLEGFTEYSSRLPARYSRPTLLQKGNPRLGLLTASSNISRNFARRVWLKLSLQYFLCAVCTARSNKMQDE